MKIKVEKLETKMNKKKEVYFLLKCDDKHSYNLPGKMGTPILNGEYEIEYDETSYEFQGKPVKSKWIKTFKPLNAETMVDKAQQTFGGTVKAAETINNETKSLIDAKIWDDSIKIVASFISGKKGEFSADEIGSMTAKMYNELLATRRKL